MREHAETYGERRRRLWLAGDVSEFTRAERNEMREADAWSRAHPREVAKLDALVGRRVSLIRAHATLACDVINEAVRIPKSYDAGTEFLVVMRTRDRLLARMTAHSLSPHSPIYLYLLSLAWLRFPQVRAPRRLAL